MDIATEVGPKSSKIAPSPEPQSLVGVKLDVSHQEWLPCSNLDDASPEEIRAIEDQLSA